MAEPQPPKLISTTVEVSAFKRVLPRLRGRPLLPTGEGFAQGWNDEGRRSEIEVRPVRASIHW